MDRVVAARKLIGDLVKDEEIEVRRVEIVGRDLAKLVDTLRRPPSGQELGEWLEEHPQVSELSASTGRLDELIDRHLREPDAPVTSVRNSELERQLHETPDELGAFQVYADWLQEHGDPLGELIALSIAAKTDDDHARFERHLKRHEAYFLGAAAGQLHGRLALTWRAGMVRAIEEIGDAVPPAVWQALLGLRVCELVEEISLAGPCSAAQDAAIAEAAPASMRRLVLHRSLGALPQALLQRPLEALEIQGHYALALTPGMFPATLARLTLRVPHLTSVVPVELPVRELAVIGSAPTFELLLQAALPRLARLTVFLEDTAAATALPLLEATRAPLTGLVLREGSIDPKTFERLAKAPLAAKLTSLGLVDLGLTDEAIAPLAAVRGFTALAELDVSDNELTREGLQTALGLAREIRSTRQHRRGHAMERRVRKLAGTRLQAAEEIADPKQWKRAGVDGDIRWARYRGEADYELFIAADLSRHGCSCPSQIRPCKHVIALALIAERTPLAKAPSHGIETRVASRAGLADLLQRSVEET